MQKGKIVGKSENIIDIKSQWFGEHSLIRTVTRQIGKRNRIIVDVTEISSRSTSKLRARKAATDAARRVGCPSVDCLNLSDHEIIRDSRNIHTDEPCRTRIRTMTFAFDGID